MLNSKTTYFRTTYDDIHHIKQMIALVCLLRYLLMMQTWKHHQYSIHWDCGGSSVCTEMLSEQEESAAVVLMNDRERHEVEQYPAKESNGYIAFTFTN